MTPTDLLRKGLMGAAILSLGACGMVESDPDRFENMARRVASIDLSRNASQDAPAAAPQAQDAGLRQALRVEVLDPHALWDARDGGLRGVDDSAQTAVAGVPQGVGVQNLDAQGLTQAGILSSRSGDRGVLGRVRGQIDAGDALGQVLETVGIALDHAAGAQRKDRCAHKPFTDQVGRRHKRDPSRRLSRRR